MTAEPKNLIAAEKRAARAELAAELFRAVARAGDERELLVLAARRIAEVLRGSVSVHLLAADGERLDEIAFHAPDAGQRPIGQSLAATQAHPQVRLAAHVLESRRAVLIESLQDPASATELAPELLALLGAARVNSVLAAPLGVRDEVVGVVAIARTGDDREPFSRDDLEFLAELVGSGSLLGSARDRAERDRAIRERDRQRQLDEAIAAFLASVAGADDEAAILGALADYAGRVVACRVAAYALAADGASYRLASVAPEGDVSPDATASLPRSVALGEGSRDVAGREPVRIPLRSANAEIGFLAVLAPGDRSSAAVVPGSPDLEFVETLAARATFAFDRVAAQRALRMEADRARVLAEFVESASEATDERQALGQLAARSSEALGCACSIYRATPDGDELEVIALVGYREADETAIRRMFAAQRWRTNEGTMGVAYGTGRTVFRPYFSASDRAAYLAALPEDRRAAMQALDMRAIIAVPLSVDRERIGVLALTRFGEGTEPFVEADLRFAEDLARRTNLALARIALARERESDARRARVIAEFVQDASQTDDEERLLLRLSQATSDAVQGSLAIYRITADGRELEAVTLTSHDETADEFRKMYARQRWRTDEGLMGAALTARRTVFRPYLSPSDRAAYLASLPEDRRAEMALRDLRAIIAIPLSQGRAQVGILTLARYGSGAEPFSDGDRAFAEDLATRASIALARIGISAEREREAARRAGLADFVTATAEATDDGALFELLAARAGEILQGSCLVAATAVRSGATQVLAVSGEASVSAERLLATFEALERDGSLADGAASPRAIAVPIHVDGAAVAVAGVARTDPASAPFEAADRTFLAELADRTAVALTRLALQAAREHAGRILRTAFDASPLATYLLDAERRVQLWNPAAERLFGYSADEVIGRYPPTVGDDEASRAGDVPSLVARGETVNGLPARRWRKDGTPVEVELYGAPVPDEHGGTALLGIYADVTERNRLQREVHRTSETLRAILDASPLPVMVVDLERRTTYWNGAAERLYGWTAEEALGTDPPYLIPGEPDPLAPLLSRVRSGESVVLDGARRRTKSGEVVEVRVFAAPIVDADGGVVALLGIHEDMRARKELEAELRQTSETLTAILDASPLAVIAVDGEMRVTFWNRAAQQIYGWTADEVLGAPPPFGPSDDLAAVASAQSRVADAAAVASEVQRTAKSGAVLDVRVLYRPLHDEAGGFRGALSIEEDVTERRRLEAQLLQAQKMETVGRLAGGVAHDFNNILTAIIGYADIARASAAEPDVQSALGTIKTAAERAAGLTQQLLAFSRRQMLQPEIVDPNEVVLGMEPILRRLIGEDIEIVSSIAREIGSVLVDRTQLEQVILNLAVNARDAMPNGGRLIIQTDRAHMSGDHPHIEMAPGNYVVISVTDTGTGMDEETKAHIFEPFFTTKGVGQGTGLGLSTVYGIVRQSGGYVWVYSEPGRGTAFRLYFPAVGGRATPPPEPARRGERRGRILLVEDDAALRELARLVLVRDGFEVAEAKSPREALAIGSTESFDLLVTDVVMPGMTGVELATKLRARKRHLRVLFMSGYTEDVAATGGHVNGKFLSKPFTPDTLLRAVDEALTDTVARGRR